MCQVKKRWKWFFERENVCVLTLFKGLIRIWMKGDYWRLRTDNQIINYKRQFRFHLVSEHLPMNTKHNCSDVTMLILFNLQKYTRKILSKAAKITITLHYIYIVCLAYISTNTFKLN